MKRFILQRGKYRLLTGCPLMAVPYAWTKQCHQTEEAMTVPGKLVSR